MTRTVRPTFAVLIGAFALIVAATAAGAATTTIDFENLSGPSFFCEFDAGLADSPLTIGEVTLTGGKILTATANLPANQTTVYGTASFCPTTNLARSLTITFARPVTRASFDLYSGAGISADYTVSANIGVTETKSVPPPFVAVPTRFTLVGRGITTLTIIPPDFGAFWDYFIDNITYTVAPQTKEECKNGGWREFGTFKNQGDCVAFVATHGRNP
jgi:hypothetical protein